MRKALLLFAVLGLAGSLYGADPIIGTWKLNIAKSKYSPVFLALVKQSVPDKESKTIEVYAEVTGDRFELTRTFVRKDGSSRLQKYTWHRYGGAAAVPKDFPFAVTETFIAPGEWYATFLIGGNQHHAIHKVVGKDGKTLSQRTTGVAPDGKFFEQIEVYDRQ